VTVALAKLVDLQLPQRDVRNVKNRIYALLALLVHLRRVIQVLSQTNFKQHVFLFLALAHLVKLLSMVFALLVRLDTIAQVEAHLAILQLLTQSCVELERHPMQEQQLVYGMERLLVLLERILIHPPFIMLRIAQPVLQIMSV